MAFIRTRTLSKQFPRKALGSISCVLSRFACYMCFTSVRHYSPYELTICSLSGATVMVGDHGERERSGRASGTSLKDRQMCSAQDGYARSRRPSQLTYTNQTKPDKAYRGKAPEAQADKTQDINQTRRIRQDKTDKPAQRVSTYPSELSRKIGLRGKLEG